MGIYDRWIFNLIQNSCNSTILEFCSQTEVIGKPHYHMTSVSSHTSE